MDVKIEVGWKKRLKSEFEKEYFLQLVQLLKNEKKSNQLIFPPGQQIFEAFNKTDFDKVKIVIIGQDPYHGPGQAHGLSFSVQEGIKPPPSLINIYKELESDLGIQMPRNYGNLTHWAKQGVLLLNATLTVRANQPNSHAGIGWQQFTDQVIDILNKEKQHLVFMLWGNFAKEKGIHIDENRHMILRAPHPSPFSADKGFFGCKHFSSANHYLMQNGIEPIDWLIKK
ncbi:MAG: uracil-DNA glycosylase [Bacteroidota bacterium]|jgi:uracil-DNA glycosylase